MCEKGGARGREKGRAEKMEKEGGREGGGSGGGKELEELLVARVSFLILEVSLAFFISF